MRPLTVGFVLSLGLVAILLAFDAVRSLAALGSGTNAGEPITKIGLIVFLVSQGFIMWVTYVRPSAVLGGFQFLRRAEREINADEPSGTDKLYGTKELFELRWLANDRVARSRSRVGCWAARIASVALLVFFLGTIMAPPVLGVGVVAETTAQVFRFVGVALVLVGVFGAVRSWRTSADVKAEAFLDRTASIS